MIRILQNTKCINIYFTQTYSKQTAKDSSSGKHQLVTQCILMPQANAMKAMDMGCKNKLVYTLYRYLS